MEKIPFVSIEDSKEHLVDGIIALSQEFAEKYSARITSMTVAGFDEHGQYEAVITGIKEAPTVDHRFVAQVKHAFVFKRYLQAWEVYRDTKGAQSPQP